MIFSNLEDLTCVLTWVFESGVYLLTWVFEGGVYFFCPDKESFKIDQTILSTK